jgi:hypothetical protein
MSPLWLISPESEDEEEFDDSEGSPWSESDASTLSYRCSRLEADPSSSRDLTNESTTSVSSSLVLHAGSLGEREERALDASCVYLLFRPKKFMLDYFDVAEWIEVRR